MRCSDCGKGEAVRFLYDPRPMGESVHPQADNLTHSRFMPALCHHCVFGDKEGLKKEIRDGSPVEIDEEEFVRLKAVFRVMDS